MSSYPTPSGPTIFATTIYSYAAQSATCPDGALTKPHAVTTAGSDTYCYDKNGNMVKRVEGGVTYDQVFDAENRLTSVTTGGQTTTFVYDGDGNLVKKVKGTTATVYVGAYEVELNNSVVTKKTSYYPGGAMRVDIVGGANTLYYSLKDHLGSASVLLDSTGNLVTNGEQRYYPFGENRITSADLKTDHLFTGQLSVGLGGIYSYGARFYSPRLGRFLSADTIVPNFADPQSLNRFAYVRNNPLKYIDPSGHTELCGVQCEEDWFGTPTNPAPSPCVCTPPPSSSSDSNLDAGLPIPSGGGGGAPPGTATEDGEAPGIGVWSTEEVVESLPDVATIAAIVPNSLKTLHNSLVAARLSYSGPKNLDTKTGRAKVHSAHEKENYAHSLSA